jgi:hypothetical protein
MAKNSEELKQKVKTKKEKIKIKTAAVKKEIKQAVGKAKQNSRAVTSNRLKLLVTIVGRNKAEFYADLIQSFDVNMQMIALATGTANERMLGLLGLTDNEKAVLFSVIREEKINDALHVLGEKFKTIKDGKGVAFTIPLTSVIGTLIYGFLSNNRTVVKEK